MNEKTEQLLIKLAGDIPALCSIWNESLDHIDYWRPGTALRMLQMQLMAHQVALGLKVDTAFGQTFGMKALYAAIDYACLHKERYPQIAKAFLNPEDVIKIVHAEVDTEESKLLERMSLSQRFEVTKASIDVMLLTQNPASKRAVGDKAMVASLEKSLNRYIHLGMWGLVDRLEKSFPDSARVARDLLIAEGIKRPRREA